MQSRPYDRYMNRTDFVTAARVDLILTLLPTIGWVQAAWTLGENNVPLEVAARVLALPLKRRQIEEPLIFAR